MLAGIVQAGRPSGQAADRRSRNPAAFAVWSVDNLILEATCLVKNEQNNKIMHTKLETGAVSLLFSCNKFLLFDFCVFNILTFKIMRVIMV